MSVQHDYEFERRYKVADLEAMRQKLLASGLVLSRYEEQEDHWFSPQAMMSDADIRQWFDHDGGTAYRIRRLLTDRATS